METENQAMEVDVGIPLPHALKPIAPANAASPEIGTPVGVYYNQIRKFVRHPSNMPLLLAVNS
jgi:hypothetical protein